jgi:hypothetical protein
MCSLQRSSCQVPHLTHFWPPSGCCRLRVVNDGAWAVGVAFTDPCSTENSEMSELTVGHFTVTCILDGAAAALPIPHIKLHPAQTPQTMQQAPPQPDVVLHQDLQHQQQGQQDHTTSQHGFLQEGDILWPPPGLYMPSSRIGRDGASMPPHRLDALRHLCGSGRPYPAGALAIQQGGACSSRTVQGGYPSPAGLPAEYITYEVLLVTGSTTSAAPACNMQDPSRLSTATIGRPATAAAGEGPSGQEIAAVAHGPPGEAVLESGSTTVAVHSSGTTPAAVQGSGTTMTMAVLGPRLYMTTNPVLSHSFAYLDSFQAYDLKSQVGLPTA